METKSSAVAEMPRVASCGWAFCYVTRDHSKLHRRVRRVYSVVTMALSCVISEIFVDVGRKS